jgi:hypothetical protein
MQIAIVCSLCEEVYNGFHFRECNDMVSSESYSLLGNSPELKQEVIKATAKHIQYLYLSDSSNKHKRDDE